MTHSKPLHSRRVVRADARLLELQQLGLERTLAALKTAAQDGTLQVVPSSRVNRRPPSFSRGSS